MLKFWRFFYLSFITFESVAYLHNFPIFPQTFLQIPPCFLSTSWPPFLPFIFYIFISWLFKYNLLGLYNFLKSAFSARDFWKCLQVGRWERLNCEGTEDTCGHFLESDWDSAWRRVCSVATVQKTTLLQLRVVKYNSECTWHIRCLWTSDSALLHRCFALLVAGQFYWLKIS